MIKIESLKIKIISSIISVLLIADVAIANTQIHLHQEANLSNMTGAPAAENAANKGKILRLIDGTLVATYGDAVDTNAKAWNYDGDIYSARDTFVTFSKDDGVTWSTPLNISNTATQTDTGVFYDPDGNGADGAGGIAPMNYFGDSDKPNIFAAGNGNNIVITWPDKYCPSGVQGLVAYNAPYLSLNPGVIQIPYSCMYAARLVNSTDTVKLISVDRLTDGSRDAKSEVPRGGGGGNAIVWQEDPKGLQPGEAEGPGDGGSGAKTSNGTNIWYSFLSNSAFKTGSWSAPQIVTDNTTSDPGASRPNLFVGKDPSSPGKAFSIVAYEERKGLGIDALAGKYVIYHVFPFDDPTKGSVPAGAGVIVSDPLENARRVRFVAKSTPGKVNGTRLIMIWKQGVEDQGGPSDIVGRVGHVPDGWDPTVSSTTGHGWRPQDLTPSVVGSADPAAALENAEPINFSSAALDDSTTTNPIDDARAHRAIMVDDFIMVGYSYTPDQAVARFTVEENYDFYVRRSFDGGTTWDAPHNLSRLPKSRSVKEPRLVGTPGSVATTCPSGDPAASDTTIPSDCQSKSTFYVAWGTELNQQESISEGSIDLDLFMSRSLNFGDTYEAPVMVAQGGVDLDSDNFSNGESQIRMTPDGSASYVSWMKTTSEGTELAFVSADFKYIDLGLQTSGGGFCSYNPRGRFDPVLPGLLLMALAYIGWRKANSQTKNVRKKIN